MVSCNKDFVWVFNGGADKFLQVNKSIARKKFNEGRKIYLLDCKVNPICLDPKHSGFIHPCVIEWKEEDGDRQFDKAVDSFEYYNCSSELGCYAHYYIKQ